MDAVQEWDDQNHASGSPIISLRSCAEYDEDSQSNVLLTRLLSRSSELTFTLWAWILTCPLGLAAHLCRPGTTLGGGIGARCWPIFVYVLSNFIVNQGTYGKDA